jgi:hypothetical protein
LREAGPQEAPTDQPGHQPPLISQHSLTHCPEEFTVRAPTISEVRLGPHIDGDELKLGPEEFTVGTGTTISEVRLGPHVDGDELELGPHAQELAAHAQDGRAHQVYNPPEKILLTGALPTVFRIRIGFMVSMQIRIQHFRSMRNRIQFQVISIFRVRDRLPIENEVDPEFIGVCRSGLETVIFLSFGTFEP